MKYQVKGKVTIEGGEPEMPLYVFVIVGGAGDAFLLQGTSTFETELETSDTPTGEVWVVGIFPDGTLTWDAPHQVALDPAGWQEADGTKTYDFRTDISWDLVDKWGPNVQKEEWPGLGAQYRVQGRVYTKIQGQEFGVPCAKVEVIEYDPQRERWWEVPSGPLPQTAWSLAERRDTLGDVWTDDQGEFDFRFTWYPWELGPQVLPGVADWAPDIILRVTQQLDGQNVLLAETDARMSIEPGTPPWEIEVPLEQVLILPRPAVPSMPGTYQSIGFLPVDSTRISGEGYATSGSGDWVQCKNAPFGGVLDIYARFDNPAVTHYRLRYARWTSGNPPTEQDFHEVTDAFHNYYRGPNDRTWRPVALGPRKLGVVDWPLYLDIEQQDPKDWLFDELKIRWNTQRLENGKYTLRIEGYHFDPSSDSVTEVAAVHDSLVLRLDNTRPIAKIEKVYQGTHEVAECSIIKLSSATQQLEVEIYVHDPEGHLGEWGLSTGYGRNRNAGGEFTDGQTYEQSGSHDVIWSGPGTKRCGLPRTTGEAWPRKCAYAFNLFAVGRSTDGKSKYLRQHEVGFSEHTYIDW